ncbi:MAG: acetyl-CoA hydrolase [Myxococcales bacterium]|nr:acetyl-CoA hydrolase [Myxococcales bacterium]MCB9569968.1 acetyl-CoA hydrolase [Myxococcales bacterium]MCB9706849.1 acetyl-CoA hydrolase [Myxococcales bacterium]
MVSASAIDDRIEVAELRRLVMPAEEAARAIGDGDVIAISGFTKAGEPKATMAALARQFEAAERPPQITLYTGASLSDEVEGPLAPFVARRGPYMSNRASRERILRGKMDYTDVHLSHFARGIMYGFYGEIDVAVVEVARITPDGVILTASVGVSPEALVKARKVILELNTAAPDLYGFHDIVLPSAPPAVGWPIPITNVADRVGLPHVRFDMSKVIAIVPSDRPDHPVEFKPSDVTSKQIAGNVIAFLSECGRRLGWRDWVPPLQSGVGNVANAVISEIGRSKFPRIHFYTEVFQEGMLELVLGEPDRFIGASSTALSLADTRPERVEAVMRKLRGKVLLRPMWLSNAPEVISRLHVVAMNTPLEVDIYGHVNSTHIGGSRIVNGLGGSGDFFRNAYISVVHTPSIRRLRDGRTISCILPTVSHVDHTEHDIKCVVTERGYAENLSVRTARHRAEEIIEKCAHPYFQPLLREYMALAHGGDEPRLEADDRREEEWWDDYEEACLGFPEDAAAE